MPFTLNHPQTKAVTAAILSFLQTTNFIGTSTPVYSLAQKGEIKDVIDSTAGGTVCCEVYMNTDGSERHDFGGMIWDEQTWFVLSLCSLDNAQTAEDLIADVRDALVVQFQPHATLSDAGNVFHAQIKPGSMRFVKIFRNGQWLRGHLAELMTRQSWQVPIPPGIIA